MYLCDLAWLRLNNRRTKCSAKQLTNHYPHVGYLHWSYGSTNAWVWSWDRKVSSKSSHKSTENRLLYWSICIQGIKLYVTGYAYTSFQQWWFFWFFWKITPAKDGKPVTIELIDAKTKEPKDTLEVINKYFTPHFNNMRYYPLWLIHFLLFYGFVSNLRLCFGCRLMQL